MEKGVFVSVEGGEGSGKTSAIELIKKYLMEKGVDFIATREPGGISIAEQIRNVILKVENTTMDARTEALLYASARRQHLVEKIVPALNNGQLVLCDRFVDSSLAYQGYARGIGVDEVYKINEFAINGLMPDVTFFLDVDPVIGLNRINKNKEREVNRLDLEKLAFHEKVREGYYLLMGRFPERIKRIDANPSVEEVAKQITDYLELSFLW